MMAAISQTALFLSRWTELSILVKAAILLAIGLTAAHLFRRSRAATGHLLLTATFTALLALPVVVLAARPIAVPVPLPQGQPSMAAPPASQPPSSSSAPTPSQPKFDRANGLPWRTIVRAVWLSGAVLFMVPLALSLWRLRRFRRDGLPFPALQERARSLAAECGVNQRVEILLHEDVAAPLTCGVLRHSILLPCDATEWEDAELRRSLVHELEHVRRCDWTVQLAASAICRAYWFLPLVWMARRRLSLDAERACDDGVIQKEEHTEYAEQLVSLARRMSNVHAHPLLGMAKRSDLAKRVGALLDSSRRRGRAGVRQAAAIVCCAALVVVAIAPLQAVAQSSARTASHPGPLTRALYEAAEEGDISIMEKIINAGADVNGALPGDGSPLIGAARKGALDAVRWLLDHGADPNMPVPGDGNPLIMAAREGHTDVVTLLLNRGADVNRVVPDDENALIQASANGRLDVVKILVSRGADVNARVDAGRAGDPGFERRSPLSMARKSGQTQVVDYLLSVGARE